MGLSRVITICGPTAVGKSAVAELVCAQVGGEVVSVDSMQIYKGMDIGTAKIPVGERTAPLHMVDVVDVDTSYSVAQFQQDARTCVDDLLGVGIVPVLCGGTGLYLDAVIDETHYPHGETNGNRRQAYEAYAQHEGPDALYQLLRTRDPQSAQLIHPNNVRRVVRALEMLDEGVSYAQHHAGLRAHLPHYDAQIFALVMSRERLYDLINTRVDCMLDEGLVDEVRALLPRGLDGNATAGQAIGYKEVMSFLNGSITLEQAINDIKRNSRHYAKRQLSWIKRDGRAHIIDMDDCSIEEAATIISDRWSSS